MELELRREAHENKREKKMPRMWVNKLFLFETWLHCCEGKLNVIDETSNVFCVSGLNDLLFTPSVGLFDSKKIEREISLRQFEISHWKHCS